MELLTRGYVLLAQEISGSVHCRKGRDSTLSIPIEPGGHLMVEHANHRYIERFCQPESLQPIILASVEALQPS